MKFDQQLNLEEARLRLKQNLGASDDERIIGTLRRQQGLPVLVDEMEL
jgi:hypothetical protein